MISIPPLPLAIAMVCLSGCSRTPSKPTSPTTLSENRTAISTSTVPQTTAKRQEAPAYDDQRPGYGNTGDTPSPPSPVQQLPALTPATAKKALDWIISSNAMAETARPEDGFAHTTTRPGMEELNRRRAEFSRSFEAFHRAIHDHNQTETEVLLKQLLENISFASPLDRQELHDILEKSAR